MLHFAVYPPEYSGFQIAVKTVREWLKSFPNAMDRVIFNVFKDEDREYYERELWIENF